MHRNTLLLVIFLAVFAALVTGVNIGKKSSGEPKSKPILNISPTPNVTPTPVLVGITNDICGISFSYPDNLEKIESSTGGLLLINKNKPSDSIAVLCQTEIPRPALTVDKTEKINIGSVSAILYHDASAKDGSPIDKLIFREPNTKLDIFISGLGQAFETVISTLTLN
jgi:hypothetical protein